MREGWCGLPAAGRCWGGGSTPCASKAPPGSLWGWGVAACTCQMASKEVGVNAERGSGSSEEENASGVSTRGWGFSLKLLQQMASLVSWKCACFSEET